MYIRCIKIKMDPCPHLFSLRMPHDTVSVPEPSAATPERWSAQALLSSPPPRVSDRLAAGVAQQHFNLPLPLHRLSGERDSNFLCAGVPGQRRVLKFINPLEAQIETEFQIEVLRHLSKNAGCGLSAHHVPACSGADWVDVRDDDGRLCRARAYSYLEGAPATEGTDSASQRRALGRALARFDEAMEAFRHPGVHRELLWDVMQLGKLAPLVVHIGDADLQSRASHFIGVFDRLIVPQLRRLRHQVIHNDLSQSNYLLQATDAEAIAGILDFGDMAHAPLVCDLAIAASYQMGVAQDPLAALDDVVAGFETVLELQPLEHELLLDVVMARVVQRLILTEWRAASFPENSAYILRHNPQARRLLTLLDPVWRSRAHQRQPVRP